MNAELLVMVNGKIYHYYEALRVFVFPHGQPLPPYEGPSDMMNGIVVSVGLVSVLIAALSMIHDHRARRDEDLRNAQTREE